MFRCYTLLTLSSMWKTTKEAGTKLRAKMTQMAWVRLMPIWRLRREAQWSF